MIKSYPLSKTAEGIYVSCLKKTDAYYLLNVVKLEFINNGKEFNLYSL